MNIILEKTFESKQFFAEGQNGNKIDCCFFPCTQGDKLKMQNKSFRTNESLNDSASDSS